MSALIQQLSQQLSGGALESLSRSIGADQKQTQSALAAALPLLVGALARNAAKPDGAQALDKAIARDHDGSILDDITSAVSSPNLSDGQGILKHVLGGRRESVEKGLGKASGLGNDQVMKMMATLAPLVLGSLGKAKRSSGLGARDLSEMLATESRTIEKREPKLGGLLTGLLDRDGDGSILDDIAGSLFRRN